MNYNRFGTFGARPQSAKSGIKKPPAKNNFAKKKEEEEPKLIQPEWNSAVQDNPHKLSQAELLQRKMLAKSNNQLSAKIEL